MPHINMTRRAFAATLAAASLPAADDGWVELFDGRSLDGWRPSENKASWKVIDGALAADGPRSHLFYVGTVRNANFKNFDFEVEALARPQCNSGVHFHTAYQESGFPVKGFEIQICNTVLGEGTYRERKKTGSLYGIRNIYKQLIADDQWFKIQVAVRGKNIQVRLNGTLVVDYTEPTPPFIPEGLEPQRFIDRGTFDLQCHNDGSKALFRSVRVRPLADDLPTPTPEPVVDETFRQIIQTGRRNYPMVDYHVHLDKGLTLAQALSKSRRDGIQYGIVVTGGKGLPMADDAGARAFLDRMKGQPVFLGMQAAGREWTQMFSRRVVAQFDYVITDAMTWTGGRGAIADPQAFMDTLVERTVGILEREPIDIYASPTYLPDAIAKDYDRLWTEARMQKVIDAAVRNGVAIEINNRYKLPGANFLRMAKSAGCKFAFGTNNAGVADLGRCEYGLQMVQECRLAWQDFFVPGAWGPKAVDRKPDALRA